VKKRHLAEVVIPQSSGDMYFSGEGTREPYNTESALKRIEGCLLCGAPVACVMSFQGYNDITRQAVLTLRQRPTREYSTPALLYGLCEGHAEEAFSTPEDLARIAQQVDDRILAAAAQVRVN
jgi:hypothetical protein